MGYSGDYESVARQSKQTILRSVLAMSVTLYPHGDYFMTNEEAKTALCHRTPVTYNGITYSYISAIIYRYDRNNNLLISAELTDQNKRSVTIAQIKDVTIYDNKNQTTSYLP